MAVLYRRVLQDAMFTALLGLPRERRHERLARCLHTARDFRLRKGWRDDEQQIHESPSPLTVFHSDCLRIVRAARQVQAMHAKVELRVEAAAVLATASHQHVRQKPLPPAAGP